MNVNEENQEGIDPTTNTGGGGRRRKRSTVKRTLRKRQEITPTAQQDLSENRTLVSAIILL